MSNKSLDNAKIKKNDEFYTQYEDIETEVAYFKDQLRDKIIFLPCDTQESNFYKYFKENFSSLGISSLRATHLERESEHSFMVEFDGEKEAIIPLFGNGDFLGKEVQSIISSSDVIITNPPFSLWKEFIDVIINGGKKFLLIANENAITYKKTFKYIKEGLLWPSYNLPRPKAFYSPKDECLVHFGNILWLTNLEVNKSEFTPTLTSTYYGNEASYPSYDNYPAINVDRVASIPIDYCGPMGVPITFLNKFFPSSTFELLGCSSYSDPSCYGIGDLWCQGRKVYKRLIIRRKQNNE